MKPSIKKIGVCLLFSTLFTLNTNLNISKASSFNESSEIQGTVKRIYRDNILFTYMDGEPIPENRFYEINGYKGYVTKYRAFRTTQGIVVWYKGYLYLGDQIPIPAKVIDDNETLNTIRSKKVRIYRHFKTGADVKSWIYYDDGTYRGSLYPEEYYENSDGSWDIYYEGIVKTVPYIINKTESFDK